MPVEKAKAWLVAINGVGPKTAAIVLLFSLGMPAFPVDTHVHRVTKRLGLIGPKVTREQAHVVFEEAMPAETFYAFHLNLILHGRQVCKARKPACEACALRDVCDYFAQLREVQEG
jgi:endonuclease-3